jgi:hypothetical protein
LCPDHRLVGRNVPPAGGGLKRRIHVTEEGRSEEREGRSEDVEDVEAHGPLGDSPTSDSPTSDRADEGDDVEAHYLGDSPSSDSPSADYLGDSPSSDSPSAD